MRSPRYFGNHYAQISLAITYISSFQRVCYYVRQTSPYLSFVSLSHGPKTRLISSCACLRLQQLLLLLSFFVSIGMQIWLLEFLRLIEDPKNVDTYLVAQFCQRKRLFNDQSIGNWFNFLEKNLPLCWTIRWWGIWQFTINRGNTTYVHLIGLSTGTVFFFGQLMR